MKASRAGTFFLMAASAAAPAGFASAPIEQPGQTLQKVADDFKFTEGPSSDARGNIFFTDQPNNRIMEYSTDGKITTFLQPCGRANGTCFDDAGNLIVCADEHNQLWSISPSGKITVLVRDYEGRLLNGPNDVWIAPDGSMYITDPFYKRDYWTRGPMEQPVQGVYRLAPDRQTLTLVVEDMKVPNGIIGTPDGQTLYISDLGAGKTFRYHIASDGTLTDKKLFCEMGSDGMTIDSEGNVYLTNHGVTIFDKDGQQIEHIRIDQPWTGNVCFGGSDRQTLFITASSAIYTLRTRVRGVGSQ